MTPDDLSTDDARPAWLVRSVDPPSRDDLALIIAWSSSEPTRIGEAARVPADGLPRLLGRGDVLAGDGVPRLRFFRERPFALEECAPLRGKGISRRHARLVGAPGGTVEFERLGGCDLLHNGARRERGVLVPGDTLALCDQLLLVVVKRPRLGSSGLRFPAARAGAFGRADAHGIVGESAAVWLLRDELAFAGAARGHTLILGPSGVGKELAAAAVHALSGAGGAPRPLVARSAASFPPTLIDAELFGNARNFPNAGMAERPGLVGAADGGTLFLDEIGELPEELQARLLRVLDRSGEYHRLGDAVHRRSNFRLVAATNRPPGSLKSDLAARFTLRIRMPDLNERREDIPLLVRHLLEDARACDPELGARFFDPEAAGGCPRLDPSFLDDLLRRRYTSHVRELGALVWRSIGASRHGYLEALPSVDAPADAPAPCDHDDDALPGVTEKAVREALARHRGSTSRAFRDLGLSSRYALYRLMKKYAIASMSPGSS